MSPWSDQIVTRMMQLSHEGYSGSRIAARINSEFGSDFTRNAVIGKLHRMGCSVGGNVPVEPAAVWTRAMEEALKAAFADGLTPLAIARHVTAAAKREISLKSLYAKAGRMGLTFKGSSRAVFVERFMRREPKPIEPLPPRVEAKRAPIAPAIEAEPLSCERVTLLDLRPHHCRFPLGEPASADFGYCGARKVKGSYCAAHARLSYLPKPKRTAKAPLPQYRTERAFARFA